MQINLSFQRADVVLSTLTSASVDGGPLKNIPKEKSIFDVTVIDECSQVMKNYYFIFKLFVP